MWIEILVSESEGNIVYVTPLAGVWIEIKEVQFHLTPVMSLPLRECGLKFLKLIKVQGRCYVTPLAGVWIEMLL